MKNKIVIKSSKSGMTVILDPDCGFEELIAELAAKFRENARFWGNIQMALMLEGRELTSKEEFQIVNTITENSGVEILCLIDHDANRIERCEKALNQKLMELSARTGQFYRGNLHRGEALESEASIVVIGDVQHGARVTAKGNIIILEMVPLQIKIADLSMHYGDKGRKLGRGPMIASVENCNICTKAIKKSYFSILNLN